MTEYRVVPETLYRVFRITKDGESEHSEKLGLYDTQADANNVIEAFKAQDEIIG